jgi:hypothetical protein
LLATNASKRAARGSRFQEGFGGPAPLVYGTYDADVRAVLVQAVDQRSEATLRYGRQRR